MDEKKKVKVLVAMSGGVDSSVAALLLKDQGFEVIGMTLKLFCDGQSEEDERCSLSAVSDARGVCHELGVPHYVFSAEEEFKEKVINNFIEEYRQGRTPSPCIRCNQLIKFDFLIRKAEGLGADLVATGHYARAEKVKNNRAEGGEYRLLRGRDLSKDQSYFLYRLNQDQLSRILFPLGELTKREVREIARRRKVHTAERKESQEVCFIENDKIKDFLRDRLKAKEGDIIDRTGKIWGKHEGVFLYTIGQRKGVGGGYKEPRYVVGIDSTKNQIIIGPSSELDRKVVQFNQESWVSGKFPERGKLQAKIRSGMELVSIMAFESGQASFTTPVKAVTPGQSIVFYRDDICLGGGIIS